MNSKAKQMLAENSVQWVHVARRAVIPPLVDGSYNFLIWDITKSRKDKDLIIGAYHPEALKLSEKSECAVIQIKEEPPLFFSPFIKKIFQLFFKINPYKSGYISSIVALLKKHKCHKVMVWSVLNIVESLKTADPDLYVAFAQRRFDFPAGHYKYNFCDSIIFQCPSQIKSAFDRSKSLDALFTVIPNGVELQTFTPATGQQKMDARKKFNLPENKFIVVFPSKLQLEKGILFLAEWIKYFNEHEPAVHFFLPGTSKYALYINNRQKSEFESLLENSPNVTWLKGVPRSDMAAVFHASDICLMSGTVKEGFSMASIEAMASSLPVISADEGCYLDILKNDFNGIKFPINELWSGTINSINELYQSSEKVKQLGMNGRKFTESMLSREKVLANFNFFMNGEFNKIDSSMNFNN